MTRTITITGTGTVRARPNYVVISLEINALHQHYDVMMDQANQQLTGLVEALVAIGFQATDVKTTDFHVSTRKEREQDRVGNYHTIFKGYECTQKLKIGFDFTNEQLGTVLAAITDSMVNPNFQIDFTVKDEEAVKAELLQAVAKNAESKAQTLCQAMGVTLGDVQTISQQWLDINLYSETNFRMAKEASINSPRMLMDFTPEEIEAQETATFTWAIE